MCKQRNDPIIQQTENMKHFAVLYRGYVNPGMEETYCAHWKTVAEYFKNHRGALGSRLYKTPENMWVAYSRWPSKEVRDRSWQANRSINEELPKPVKTAIQGIYDCLLKEEPEICMEIVDEVN